jgi:hypothetical protein
MGGLKDGLGEVMREAGTGTWGYLYWFSLGLRAGLFIWLVYQAAGFRGGGGG